MGSKYYQGAEQAAKKARAHALNAAERGKASVEDGVEIAKQEMTLNSFKKNMTAGTKFGKGELEERLYVAVVLNYNMEGNSWG